MQFAVRFFFAVLYLVILTASITAAHADGISFRVSPLMTDLAVDPGTTQTSVITLYNNALANSPPLHVKVSIKDWTLDTAGQMKLLDAGTGVDGCGDWVQVDPLELNVPAGQSEAVRYTVAAPAASQGSYHCVILFTTDPQPGVYQGEAVHICGCIGNTVYVQCGPIVRRAKITSLTMTSSSVLMTVQNTGSSYVRLGGVVKVADSTGAVVQQIKIPGDAVLPQTDNTRLVTLDLTTPLPPGAYTLTALLDYGGDALLGARVNVVLP